MKIYSLRNHLNQLCGVANIWSCAKWLTLCGTLVDERNECFGDSNAHWCKTPLYLAAVVWLCQILTSCFSEFKKTGGVFVGTLFGKKLIHWQFCSMYFKITNRYRTCFMLLNTNHKGEQTFDTIYSTNTPWKNQYFKRELKKYNF